MNKSDGSKDEEDELNELYRTSVNKRLKYWVLSSICISIILMFAIIIWIDEIGYKYIIFMRGCSGLFALIFVILCTILVYRVNRDYITKR